MTTDTRDFASVHAAAHAADAAWQTELTRLYGRRAGDARYDGRGRATVELARLHEAKLRADAAEHALWVAHWAARRGVE